MQRTQAITGFTLIDLLIALIIIGILSTIAYPSYQQFMIRAKLHEATNNLANYRLQLEQYYQDNRSYLGKDNNCAVQYKGTSYFNFSCSATTATYTLLASNNQQSGLGNTDDYLFSIDQSGNLSTIKYKGTKIHKNCWLIKGNEC